MQMSKALLLAATGIAGAVVLGAVAQEKKSDEKPVPTTSSVDLKFPPEAMKPNLPADFQPYIESIPGTNLRFMMIPIPGGEYVMGSPATEAERQENEGPQVKVKVEPFWMAACEVTWDEYDQFSFSYDIKAAKEQGKTGGPVARTQNDVLADAVTRPTPPYVDMTFGKGHDRFPASCMTSHAAIHYCTGWPPKRAILIGCRLRRNGNTRLVRERKPHIRLETILRRSTSSRGIPTTRRRSRIQSCRRSRTLGASTTCTATFANGASTNTTPTTSRNWIPPK